MAQGASADRDPVQRELVSALSGETLDWLVDNGVEFSDKVTQGVGSTAYRAHQSMPDANELVSGLPPKPPLAMITALAVYSTGCPF